MHFSKDYSDKALHLWGSQREILATALIHEIGHVAKTQADAAEFGVRTSEFDDLLAHLRRLLDMVTED